MRHQCPYPRIPNIRTSPGRNDSAKEDDHAYQRQINPRMLSPTCPDAFMLPTHIEHQQRSRCTSCASTPRLWWDDWNQDRTHALPLETTHSLAFHLSSLFDSILELSKYFRPQSTYICIHGFFVEFTQSFRHRPHTSSPDYPSIDLSDRNMARKRTSTECLIRAISLREREVTLKYWNALLFANLNSFGSSDALHLVGARGRPHLTIADDEEICRVAGLDEAVRAEH